MSSEGETFRRLKRTPVIQLMKEFEDEDQIIFHADSIVNFIKRHNWELVDFLSAYYDRRSAGFFDSYRSKEDYINSVLPNFQSLWDNWKND